MKKTEEIKLKSNLETRFYSLGISTGVFKNEDEAIKYANNLKIYLERICKKKNFDCFALVTVSQNNGKEDIEHRQCDGKQEDLELHLFQLTETKMVKLINTFILPYGQILVLKLQIVLLIKSL